MILILLNKEMVTIIAKFSILTTKRISTDLVRAIVLPIDSKLWPELRQPIIDFKISPTDKIVPHRGKVFIAFVGNYFGPGRDNVLTVSLWRQFN